MRHRTYTAGATTFAAFVILNALSYFHLGDGDLFDSYIDDVEAMGFPLKFWERGGFAGVRYVSLPSLIIDIVTALSVSVVVGYLVKSSSANRVESGTATRPQPAKFGQYSIAFLLICMTYVAVLCGLARSSGLTKAVFIANQLLVPTLLWVCRRRMCGISGVQVTLFVVFVVGIQIAVGLVVGHAFLGYFVETCLTRIYVASVLVYAGLLASNFAYQWWRSTNYEESSK